MGDIVPLSVASRSNFLIIINIYVYFIIIIISLGVRSGKTRKSRGEEKVVGFS